MSDNCVLCGRDLFAAEPNPVVTEIGVHQECWNKWPDSTSAVKQAAEDVRYAGGNGTSDYWRGFNDGIDKLAARLAPDTEDA